MVQLIALLWILSQPCSPTQQKENENWTKFDLLKLTLSSIRSTIFHMKKLFAANFYVTHHLNQNEHPNKFKTSSLSGEKSGTSTEVEFTS